MTKEGIIGFVNYLDTYPETLMWNIVNGRMKDDIRAEWVEDAQVEWLDPLVEAMQDIPDTIDGSKIDKESWYAQFEFIVEDWIAKEPLAVIEKVGPLLRLPEWREGLLIPFMQANRAEVIPWVKPLIDEINELSETQLIFLIGIVGDNPSPEAPALFEEIDKKLPIKTETIQGQFDFYRNRGESKVAE